MSATATCPTWCTDHDDETGAHFSRDIQGPRDMTACLTDNADGTPAVVVDWPTRLERMTVSDAASIAAAITATVALAN